jgi:hypothetical protein
MEKEILNIIQTKGPLTGNELYEITRRDLLSLWKHCMLSKELLIKRTGVRYLRLDKCINGYARLSPSILREFLTYSVIGLHKFPELTDKKANEISRHIIEVSRTKYELIFNTVVNIKNSFGDEWKDQYKICFILAGDIVYNMAHDVPRPEKSTGEMVNGSDIDLIVVLDNIIPDSFKTKLDESIYKEKYKTLVTPYKKEEIDYIVKKMDAVDKQIKFSTFKDMLACKILDEGTLLFGDIELFSEIKKMLADSGAERKLNELKITAIEKRKKAEEFLLAGNFEKPNDDIINLFYSREESEEFE